jgi:hypothetical protein
MINDNLMIVLGLIFGAAFLAVSQKPKTKEHFLGNLPSFKWKIDRIAAPNQQSAAQGNFYSVPGTYQSLIAPRFSNVDYGANIRYNLPSANHRGVPVNPVMFGKMASNEPYVRPQQQVRENYSSNGNVPTCRKGGAPQSFSGGAPVTEPDYANGNYNQVLNDAYKNSDSPDVTAVLPVNDMTAINASGDLIQPIVYDRYIYANRNSRLRSQGDPIRGDLAIVPCSADWFRPSVQPNIDLQEGAMNVMGGVNNESIRALTDLINKSSGGGETAIGGVNLENEYGYSNVDMSNQFSGGLSAGLGDVQVRAFP